MTAISTLLSTRTIACASDSFLTKPSGDIIEARQPKIVCVKPLKIVIAYFGLARTNNGFDTFQYLKQFASENKNLPTAEKFCHDLCNDLTARIKALKIPAPANGLGLHIGTFEKFDDVQVPEMFYCSNFAHPAYQNTTQDFSLSRDSFKSPSFPARGAKTERLAFFNWLQHKMTFFNNGDPGLFNPVANAVMQMSMTVRQRGIAVTSDRSAFYRHWVREPIKVIGELQKRLCKRGKRVVGGAVHDVLLHSSGEFELSSDRIPVFH